MTAKPRPELPTITVGQLRSQLAAFDDDWTLDFCGLAFYRFKARGDRHVQCEFSQPVYLDQHTGRVIVENPDIDIDTDDDGDQ